MAHCTKCGINHARPVGARFKRNLNVSAPVFTETQEVVEQLHDQAPEQRHASSNNVASASTSINEDAASQVESKLDLIPQNMQELENENSRLEKRLDEQHLSVGLKPQPTYNSPKCSHKCSIKGDLVMQKKRRMVHTAKQVKANETSDEDLTDFSTLRLLALKCHSCRTTRLLGNSHPYSSLKMTIGFKRKCKQLERLQGQPRGATHSGNKTFKSGLHRAGDTAIKVEIPWPHHHCFLGQGGNLPEYKHLSPIQFMIGFMGCIQEEQSNTVRSNMLEYVRHLLQDALETNWATARHAHLILLQDIERGKCSWRRPDVVEKIRIRNTARVISQKSGTSPKTGKTTSKDKICFDFNANTCKFTSDHVVDGQIMKHACSYCHKQVGKLCYHKLQDCIQRWGSDAEKDNPKHS